MHNQNPVWFDAHRKDHSKRQWLLPLALTSSALLWLVILFALRAIL